MRELRVDMVLGTSGMQKGVAESKSLMGSLQSQFRMAGKNLTALTGFGSTRAGIASAKALTAQIGAIRNVTAQHKEFQKLLLARREILVATRAQITAEHQLTAAMRAQAQHWVNRCGLGGILQRIQAGGGANSMLATMAGYFGGGRMGGLGGAVGGMFGAAGWGAAIGTAIGAIMSALRRLFDFFKSGILDLVQFATGLQSLKAQTGLSFRTGTIASRAAEMGGLDMSAVGIWFSRFQANIGNIEKTSPKVSNALMMMGLSLAEIRTQKPDELFGLILERLATMNNINDRNAAAMALFNRQGTQMTKMLLNWKLSAEQVGDLSEHLNKVAWVDNAGQIITYADALSYMDKTISGLKWKRRGFIAGFTEGFGAEGVIVSKLVNKVNAGTLGKLSAEMMKSVLSWILPGGHALRALDTGGLFKWIARKITIPKAGDPNLSGAMGPLSSFFAPFGKGPGDQWSKIGAFSAPGVMQGFATGIQTYQNKVVEKLTEIANNTRNFHFGGATGQSSGFSFAY